MRHNRAKRESCARRQKERELIHIFDQDVGSLGFHGAADRTATEESEAVATAHPADVDTFERGTFSGAFPAGAHQPNAVPLRSESPEDLEEVDLCAAGVRIGSILPVYEKDVHNGEDALEATQRASDAVEDAIDEAGRARVSKPVRKVHCLIDGHLGRHLPESKLVDAEPEDVALHHRDPIHAPIFRRTSNLRIQCADIGHDARSERFRPIQDSGLGTG
jgi:hypothetical protein